MIKKKKVQKYTKENNWMFLNVEMNPPSYLVLGTSGCFFFFNYYFCIIKHERVYEPQKHTLPHHAVKPFLHAFEFLHWPLPAAPAALFFLFVFLSLYFVVLLHPMLLTLLTLWLTNKPWENPTSSCSSGESDFHIERQSWHSQPSCSSFLASSSGLCCESKAADKLSCVLYRFQGQILYTVFTLTLAFVYIRQYMSIINGL